MLNIASFIKSLLPSFSKSDLESDMETSLDSISTINDVYSSLDNVTKVAKLNNIENKKLIKEFYKEFSGVKHKVKLSSNMNIALDTVNLFKNVKENGEHIYKEISDAINDVVVSDALTAYKANLLRCVSHYYFMTKYALDLINFFYVMEAEESKSEVDKEYMLNKKQKEFVVKNMWVYSRMLALYGEPLDEFKHKLDSIDEITLPKEEIDLAISAYDSDNIDLFNNLPAGFIGSPIYSIRLAFATWDANRYRALKDKKKLLELRYLHMKLLKENGNFDITLEKEITFLQKRLTTIDYELSKIEKSVED